MNYEAMKEELAQRLQKKRYEHSLGVADTAAMLAGRFGVDVERRVLRGFCMTAHANIGRRIFPLRRHGARLPTARSSARCRSFFMPMWAQGVRRNCTA